MRIPSRVVKSRCGVYYFRLTRRVKSIQVPRKEVRVSLGTKDPYQARLRSMRLSLALEPLVAEERSMSLKKEDIEKHFPHLLDRANRQELDVILKPDGERQFLNINNEEDLARAKILLESLPPAAQPAPVSQSEIQQAATVAAEKVINSGAPAHTLNDTAKAWFESLSKRVKPPADSTIIEWRSKLNRLIRQFGADTRTSSIQRHQLYAFVNSLPGITLHTQSDYGSLYALFFKFAKNAGHYLAENPATGLTSYKKSKDGGYEPFTPDQLKAIFETDYLKHNDKPHEYFPPIIALYTAARINEICQLLIGDISSIGDIWCMHIKESLDEDEIVIQTVKTESAVRTIPLHRNLIDLGLLEYRRRLLEAGFKNEDLLFPYLTPDVKGRYSRRTYRRFHDDIVNLGFYKKHKTVFHSLRMNAIDTLKQNLPDSKHWEARCEFSGHAYERVSQQGSYTQKFPPAHLAENILPALTYDLAFEQADISKLVEIAQLEMSITGRRSVSKLARKERKEREAAKRAKEEKKLQ